MPWFALLIPIVLGIFCLFIFRHKLVWWEVLLPIVVGIITIAAMKAIMINGLTSDTEYLSEYPVEARYYEDWNERVSCRHPKYCTRTYKCGKSTCTSTYICGYHHAYDVDYHAEYWRIYTNTGNSRSINKNYYDYLRNLWSNTKFKDLHRSYHSNDGDMYYSKFDGVFEHIEPRTYKHTYENKAQAATNIFKFRELDSLEIKDLHDYPKIYGKARQDNCIGCSKEDNLYLERYNAYIGKRLEIKMYVLVFENKSIEVAERQMVYWKGGNMNELVVCVDKNGDWVKTFSWCDDKTIEAEVNDIFMRDIPFREKLHLMELEAEQDWKRKDFHKDFDYIDIPLSTSQLIWIYVVVFILSIGCLIFGIRNDIEQE